MSWLKKLLSTSSEASSKRVIKILILTAFLICLGWAVAFNRAMIDLPAGWVNVLIVVVLGQIGDNLVERIKDNTKC